MYKDPFLVSINKPFEKCMEFCTAPRDLFDPACLSFLLIALPLMPNRLVKPDIFPYFPSAYLLLNMENDQVAVPGV
jgi:hypothetical protein